MRTSPVDPAAVITLLTQLGLSADDLRAALEFSKSTAPTLREYLPTVEAGATSGAARAYRSYWNRLAEHLGDKSLDEVTTSDIMAVAAWCQNHAIQRRSTRSGRGAHENLIAAARYVWNRAVNDQLVSNNPASSARKQRRMTSHRRGLTPAEVADLDRIARDTGDDPLLDTLLVRFHLETGARRGGALALRLHDLDPRRQTVLLREKGDTERQQPVTSELVEHLLAHAKERGAVIPVDRVFRYRDGHVLTPHRYSYLTDRWREHLPWAEQEGVSIHWLRHTAITDTERIAGYAVAAKFAGHSPGAGSVTGTYTKGSLAEVAHALVLRTGMPHPLAPDLLPPAETV